MKTTSDLRELLDKYDKRIVEHLNDYRINKGTNLEDNRAANALAYHLEDAYISLEKGLKGEF